MGFTLKIVKPTQAEINLKKFKGGDWFVRRIDQGPQLRYHPTGWKGVTFTLFCLVFAASYIAVTWLVQPLGDPFDPNGWKYLFGFFITILALSIIGGRRTFKPVDTPWNQFMTSYRLWRQKKGVFKRP